MTVIVLAVACGHLAAGAATTPAETPVATAIASAFERRGTSAPILSHRLSQAAARVHEPAQDKNIRARLRFLGVTEGLVVPVTARGVRSRDGVRRRLAEYVEQSVVPQGVTHYGFFERDDRVTIVFVRQVLTEVVWPSATASGGSDLFRARVASRSYRSFALAIGRPDGSVVRAELRRRGHWVEGSVTFDRGDGAYIVEVTALGPHGAEVLAIEEVFVGVPALQTIPLARPSSTEPCVTLEARLVDRVNRERRRLGLADLVIDPELVKTARRHARDMMSAGLAAHRLPGGLAARSRLRRSGIRTGRFFENVAMAATIEQAHRELWRSPSHRLALIDPLVERIGVGVVRRRADVGEALFITQHLAAVR